MLEFQGCRPSSFKFSGLFGNGYEKISKREKHRRAPREVWSIQKC